MIDPNLLCMRCMGELTHENGVCPHCGFDNASPSNEPHQLECRSILVGSYLVGCVLGQGGFGITYVGWDLNLDLKIAIKEYYPEILEQMERMYFQANDITLGAFHAYVKEQHDVAP